MYIPINNNNNKNKGDTETISYVAFQYTITLVLWIYFMSFDNIIYKISHAYNTRIILIKHSSKTISIDQKLNPLFINGS